MQATVATVPGFDGAVTWLRHCQRFGIVEAEAESIATCEQAIAKQFLQLMGGPRRSLLETLSPASLLRITHAYARAAAAADPCHWTQRRIISRLPQSSGRSWLATSTRVLQRTSTCICSRRADG